MLLYVSNLRLDLHHFGAWHHQAPMFAATHGKAVKPGSPRIPTEHRDLYQPRFGTWHHQAPFRREYSRKRLR
jgi:hypothetical protein